MGRKCKEVKASEGGMISLRGVISWSLRGYWTVWYPWCIVVVQMLLIVLLLTNISSPTYKTVANHKELDPLVKQLHLANQINDLQTDQTLLSELPISPTFSQSTRLFYNRVPKCASSTLIDVILEMTRYHNFTFYRSPIYMAFHIDPVFQGQLIENFMNTETPFLYERHLHFMDFTKYNSPQPAYFNLVRDPQERLVSWYYFRRYQAGHIRNMPTNKRVRSYDACVLGNYSECVDPMGTDPEEGYFKLIPFFCGQEDFCRTPGEKSLVRAIQNVKKYYAIVGLTEEFEDFVEALEYVMPSFFRGASLVYDSMKSELQGKHKTTFKLPVTGEVKLIMYPKLKHEYQFYNFLKNRFHKLSHSIKAIADSKKSSREH